MNNCPSGQASTPLTGKGRRCQRGSEHSVSSRIFPVSPTFPHLPTRVSYNFALESKLTTGKGG